MRASSTLGGKPVKTEPVFNPRYVICGDVLLLSPKANINALQVSAMTGYEWIDHGCKRNACQLSQTSICGCFIDGQAAWLPPESKLSRRTVWVF